MRALVETLCSEPCAGRKPGTPEGRAARGEVLSALRLRSLVDLTTSLAAVSPEADQARAHAEGLLAICDRDGRLPAGREGEVGALVGMLESRLA